MGSKKPETADFSKNNPSFILRYSLAHQNDPISGHPVCDLQRADQPGEGCPAGMLRKNLGVLFQQRTLKQALFLEKRLQSFQQYGNAFCSSQVDLVCFHFAVFMRQNVPQTDDLRPFNR
jgi:hypothetical protein